MVQSKIKIGLTTSFNTIFNYLLNYTNINYSSLQRQESTEVNKTIDNTLEIELLLQYKYMLSIVETRLQIITQFTYLCIKLRVVQKLILKN